MDTWVVSTFTSTWNGATVHVGVWVSARVAIFRVPRLPPPGGTELLGPMQLPARLAEGPARSPDGRTVRVPSSGAEGSSPETSEVSPSLWGVQPEPGRSQALCHTHKCSRGPWGRFGGRWLHFQAAPGAAGDAGLEAASQSPEASVPVSTPGLWGIRFSRKKSKFKALYSSEYFIERPLGTKDAWLSRRVPDGRVIGSDG